MIGEKVLHIPGITQSDDIERLLTVGGQSINEPQDLDNDRQRVAIGCSENSNKANCRINKESTHRPSKGHSVSKCTPVKEVRTKIRKTARIKKPKTNYQESTKIESMLSANEFEPALSSGMVATMNLLHAKDISSTSTGPVRKVDFNQDLGLFYRAKQQNYNTEELTEINETPDITVNLPFDQADAEEAGITGCDCCCSLVMCFP
ncbi:uncharacterized protein LOC111086791 isoform X2 [Limulus polyphemus]|uniref:Uncharacterized protein LOC111086791 isoform X2 n=1 Tax=Limulus polyphemus TaxID=6850 RepID=A0ABM1ST34_LIMPO|nr:uncharacterized protein LOC111086791 isoform X2 [Limulus polyphemus]